ENVSTLGVIVAANSSAALAFDSADDADEILRALKGNKHIVTACLYNKEGKLFASYIAKDSQVSLPEKPLRSGYYFEDGYLKGFEPVVQSNERLGTLYIQSDLKAMYAQLQHFIMIAFLLIVSLLVVAYLLSDELQKSISQPILSLQKTAWNISASQDYSIRAVKSGEDEIGSLTDTFNEMLGQIETQSQLIINREEHLRLATQAAELGTFDMNIKNGHVTWDSRCKQLVGIYKEASDESGEHIIDGVHDKDSDRIRKLLIKVLDREATDDNYDMEFRITGFNNKERWVRVKGKVFVDAYGKPVRFLGAVLDITNQKQEELRKNDFIAIISHELKTPLTTIKSYVQILLEKAKKDQDNFELNALGRAEAQTTRMTAMIKGFLSLARIEEGKLRIDKSKFSLNTFFEDIIAEAAFLTASHTIQIQSCEDIMVYADRDKISQVLINLLSNAIKYSSPGSTIIISCVKGKGEVTIYVKDDGIGINPEDQKHLFNRFYRIENEKMNTVSGFGIGLYLVSEILRYHGSKIQVTSEEGQGSTFYFSLETMEDSD
ncbi:MAG TPA: ATP-binding protein, partial [Sphingobacteriaceae bacterium]